jgi:hypothetical protein
MSMLPGILRPPENGVGCDYRCSSTPKRRAPVQPQHSERISSGDRFDRQTPLPSSPHEASASLAVFGFPFFLCFLCLDQARTYFKSGA